jgi:hypothetical protein
MNAPVKISSIHGKMVEILRELDAIGKDQKNTQQGFQYRGIDQVYNAINPILAKHGVYMTAEVLGKTREERTNKNGTVLAFTCLRMRYHFHAEDGSSVSTEAEGEGMDSGDKSSNKAMAVAHKYALLQAFCVPTKDLDDPDKESHEVVAKPAPTPAPAPTQREVIHQPKTLNQDPDVLAGNRNWIDTEKANITACERLPDMYQWLDENGESWSEPVSGSNLWKTKRSCPTHFEEIKAHYLARMAEINKKGTK